MRLILTTHHHRDHTDAVDALVARTGASARAISPEWCRVAEPLHNGEAIAAGDEAVRELREHRLGRLKQIQDALAQLGEAPRVDEGPIDRLVELIYPGVAAAGAARLSVAAQLDYLAGA